MRPLHAAPMPSPEESAEALRAYMVKSGERSAKYEKEIQELKAALAEKGGAVGASSPPPAPAASAITTMGNTGGLTSSAPPATNLAASQKIREYHDFISKYIVNSQLEKQRAVIAAESKVRSFYEEKLASLSGSPPSAAAAIAP
eukprot:CAMPEP_0182464468 /NCGR_PEP_ID=MMETSP1319-20130603/8666_1 /TAXON_ID=172717 /ORGANISM="Bolidomonas pacifica, Strain RCC208" /LENGTH=143 /DNA_ID=CAMNT_0024664113 /DNA_START=123 /DNA_END=551 /DNA_ORIENTATION=+